MCANTAVSHPTKNSKMSMAQVVLVGVVIDCCDKWIGGDAVHSRVRFFTREDQETLARAGFCRSNFMIHVLI